LNKDVVILPRVVPQLHDMLRWAVTPHFGDRRSWDMSTLVDLLQRFATAAGVTLFPSLEEYRVLPDKVQLHNMYQSYYEKVSTPGSLLE
jgi:hypothetical protein